MGSFILAGQQAGGGQYLRRRGLLSPAVPFDPSQYYVPGNGDPAVSTSDYYHLDGLYWFRCYDLLTMGSPGAAAAAAHQRYYWTASTDHPNSNYSWSDAWDIRAGFSSDPGVLPDTLFTIIVFNNTYSDPDTTTYELYQAPWLVYNPDNGSFPFYIYAEGTTVAGNPQRQHEEGYAYSTDLLTWTMGGVTHRNASFSGWSSFQQVTRNGTGDWVSVGLSNTTSYNGYGKYTSTDGITFTLSGSGGLFDKLSGGNVAQKNVGTINSGDRTFQLNYGSPIVVDGVTYCFGKEDATRADGGQYVVLVPIDSNYNVLNTPAVTRLSSVFGSAQTDLQTYPSPWYLQDVKVYLEDGVAHLYPIRGFPPSSANQSLQNNVPYYRGGGLWNQFVDYYTYIYDATAAAAAAPIGVQASCDAGVVTVSWYNALPNYTYRVYKGSSAGTQATLVGDVSGTSITDSPTSGQWWYKVVTLESGAERANRVVHTYVSANSALANKHINRVIDDGGDVSTINQTWLQTCIDWAVDNDLDNCIEFWADAGFGVKLSAGQVIKVYCLGTTILPRGGDLTMATSHTTYSATGLNSTAPAWTNPATTDRAYFGGARVNNIRRKMQCTVFAAYKKPSTGKGSFIGQSTQGTGIDGLGLEHSSGTPGTVSIYLSDATHCVTATVSSASASGVHVAIGFFDGTNLTAYSDGVAGTPQTGVDTNLNLDNGTTLKGLRGVNYPYPCLVSGCSATQYTSGRVRSYLRAEANWTASCIGMFSKGFTDAQAISFDAMQATHIGR